MHLFLQGLRVESNPSSGVRILAGGKNLVLQGIRRHHSGNYTCTAFNLEGEDTSNPVAITVMCKLRHFLFEQFWPWRLEEKEAKTFKTGRKLWFSDPFIYLWWDDEMCDTTFVVGFPFKLLPDVANLNIFAPHHHLLPTEDTNSSPFERSITEE